MATECSWNDGSKAQYYVVILDRLLGHSGGLERAPEWHVRGPLTVALVGLFKKGIHPALARKLVEIGQLRNSDSLDEWYKKALSFERSRRDAIEEFGGRKIIENLGDVRKKPVLDVLRRDPSAMDVDRYRETRRCYNCKETGHLAARCSKPRKERREEVRITKNAMEDFSLGRK